MEGMYYPTGASTKGRTLVCMCCEADVPVMEGEESPDVIETKIKNWLDENQYCVEKWQMDSTMESSGCGGYELREMEGGAPAGDGGGGAFATLGTTQGMGNVTAPAAGGTNADFYDGAVGSGDKFTSLTVGTPAASGKGKKKKKKKKKRIVKGFDDFLDMMKTLQES